MFSIYQCADFESDYHWLHKAFCCSNCFRFRSLLRVTLLKISSIIKQHQPFTNGEIKRQYLDSTFRPPKMLEILHMELTTLWKFYHAMVSFDSIVIFPFSSHCIDAINFPLILFVPAGTMTT